MQNRISDIMSKMSAISNKNRNFIDSHEKYSPLKKTDDLKPEGDDYKAAAGTFNEQLERMIRDKSNKYGVSEDLIKAVIKTESNGNQGAVSKAGAVGLMQLMPGTAKILGVNPEDPEENIDGGVRYLKNMSKEFNSLDEVLAAYNAGPGSIKKHGGIPPYGETKNYIKQIRRYLK